MTPERGVFPKVVAAAALLALAPLCPLFAAPGSVSGYSLRIIQSPRLAGMGEVGAGMYGELLGATETNPAALNEQFYKEAALTYSSWLEGITLQKFAYVHPLGEPGALALVGSMLQVKPFAGYDNFGNSAGDVTSSDAMFAAVYSKRLKGPWDDRRRGLFAGASLKYARETIETASASSILFDAGLLSVSRLGPGLLGLGVSAVSLGSGYKFDVEKDKAPTAYRAGASYQIMLWGDPLTVAADVIKPVENVSHYAAGMELVLWHSFAWRMGYLSGQDVGNGIRFGAGFNLKVVQIDYALASFGDFGLTHRMAVSVKFGKPIEITPHLTPAEEQARWRYGRAKELIAEKRYYDAILELDESLKLDPNFKDAVLLMGKARNLMETQ
ncbi:MAG: PorV/PorQ family protein [Elusimicrobiales bacterium]|nr:PorV/PorQ family protein [Elusimicrobiales bacterium]